MSIGVPIKVLHESEGHIITLEIKTGEMFRGKLVESEDNMNCQLSDVTVTHRDGKVVGPLQMVFIRGSKIRFFVLPDMFKNAPMFKHSGKGKYTGSGPGSGSGAGARKTAKFLTVRGRGTGRGRGSRGGGDRGGRGGASAGGGAPTKTEGDGRRGRP